MHVSIGLLSLALTHPGLLAGPLLSSQAWGPGARSEPLEVRVPPPAGFRRVPVEAGSFGAWLRRLPVLPGRPEVHLYDGRRKANQRAQHVVLDVDVGSKDLQQCADAVIRLRAEYLWSSGRRDEVCFKFTSGDRAAWKDWKRGVRPEVRGAKVRFAKRADPDDSYRSFRHYLDKVFTYAGTASLSRGLRAVPKPAAIQIGDVFIQGGFPGHAVLVVDMVEDEHRARRFLLAQSYMPAQQIHVLKNPGSDSPWYSASFVGSLETPEWTFEAQDLMRFPEQGCP